MRESIYSTASRSANGSQVAAQHYALLQLPEVGRIQLAVQLRLPRQNDLQQLAVTILKIPQQPDLFEHFPFEVMRLVHDQHHGLAVLGLLHQQLVQREQHLGLRSARTGQVEIVGDHLEELLDVDAGIKKKRELDVVGLQVIPEALEHRGLARSYLAG